MTTFPCFQRKPRRRTAWPFLRRLCLFPALVLGLGTLVFAQGPQWWTNGVLTNMAVTNDYAPVNAGQLKNLACHAYQEMQATFPGAAAAAVSNLVFSLAPGGDFSPVNIGQLKHVAQPFYSNLIAIGYTSAYPWAGSPTPNDFAPANIGQLKNVFGFDPGLDTDGDGMPDWWEILHSLNPNDPADAELDLDGDGWTNLEEFMGETNPNDPHSHPANCWYVATNGMDAVGGGSYANPFATLTNAFAQAQNGHRVILLPGIYTGAGNREVTFSGKSLVVSGVPGHREDTIIDCEHIAHAFQSDSGETVLIQHLSICNGASPQGGAIAADSGSLSLRLCNFTSNSAIFGGAICSWRPLDIVDCVFDGNLSSNQGGAIYCEDDFSCAKSRFAGNTSESEGGAVSASAGEALMVSCEFENNQAATQGGAIYSQADILLSDCLFVANASSEYAGAVYMETGVLTADSCEFIGNQSGGGGALYCFEITATGCHFISNQAYSAGAVYCGEDSSFADCRFASNQAEDNSGGAIYAASSITMAENCDFENNWTGETGGAVHISAPSTFMRCRFSGNASVNEGGAVFQGVGAAGTAFNACRFEGNESEWKGGAAGIYSQCTFENSLFRGNRAPTGGALYIANTGLLNNCTVIDNETYEYEGGAISVNNATMLLMNSIVWGNVPYQFRRDGATTVRATNCCIEGWIPSGTGNISIDPLFAIDGWHLSANSPCLNAGLNLAGMESQIDLDGQARIWGGTVDIGADERGEPGTNPDEVDSDGDGLTDFYENMAGLDPSNADTDGDGMPDGWEVENGLNPLENDADLNPDEDGLSNGQEYVHGTNPANADSDDDGLSDGEEVLTYETDPNDEDSDVDGLTDGAEVNEYGTNPLIADTDGDGMTDGWELQYGLNPLSGQGEDLMGWWKLDDGGGTNALNSAVNGYHGELRGFSEMTNNGWVAEGRLGGALWFDGADDWVQIDQNPAMLTGGAFTVSAQVWLDENCTSDWPKVVSDIMASTWDGYCLGFDSNDKAFAMVGAAGWVQDTNVLADQWVWMALEFDGTNICLYRNGARVGSSVPASFTPATNGFFAIGNGQDVGSSEHWKGMIDDVRIYRTALGTNGLAAMYDAWSDPDNDGLTNLQEFQIETSPNVVDTDGDGLLDSEEVNDYGTNPAVADTDGDGLSDGEEVNDHGTDPLVGDTDGDGMPDGWEVQHELNPLQNDAAGDADEDGLTNLQEYQIGTDPQDADTDDDGMPDNWEVVHGLYPNYADASADVDLDGVSNLGEYQNGTDPRDSDTDGDGMADGWEVSHNGDPLVDDANEDEDGDGLSDGSEYQNATSPDDDDTDGDGMPDGWEVDHSLDPRHSSADQDSDADGLTDYEEWGVGTDPLDADTDDDGMPDGWEVDNGLNPQQNDANLDPDEDGLTNLGEFQAGWNPQQYDSDGDGFSDGAEVGNHTYPSNACADDGGDDYDCDDPHGPNQGEAEIAVSNLYVVVGDSNKFAVTHRIVTDNTPRGRSLCGTLSLILISGSATNFELRIVDDGYTLGSPVDVEETGHSGCGIHTWHSGVVEFQVIGMNPSTNILEAAVDPDPDDGGNGAPTKKARIKIIVVTGEMLPDFDHDRDIDGDDAGLISANPPYRFWINDDDDAGDVARGDNDLPGHLVWGGWPADYSNGNVDGLCDLPDFFPVWLNLNQVLNALPPSGSVQCKLKHAAGGLNAVITDLTKESAGNYLTNNHAASDLYNADTFQITANGTNLPAGFITEIKTNASMGILLIEGAKKTASPLVMEIWKNGVVIQRFEMPISIDGVEEMYRWINLRTNGASGGHPTNIDRPPSNNPDVPNGKHLAFIHGFNVDMDGARASAAEVFKRLYWSGSKAMYCGVTWDGNEYNKTFPLPAVAYYHADVINAFEAAEGFNHEVSRLPGGQMYVMAHSLGNMVVASAIKDYGLDPVQYFMVDAAVAMEAFNANDTTNSSYMTPYPWQNYSNRLYASEWYKLFTNTVYDARGTLTWRNRFGNIPQAINYYSSGEDVLETNGIANPDPDWPFAWPIWCYSELTKGRWPYIVLPIVRHHGGWQFNTAYQVLGNYPNPNMVNSLPDATLRTNSVFQLFFPPTLYKTNGAVVASNRAVRCKLLAEALPATSFATGANEIRVRFSENIDMMELKNEGRWPYRRYETGPENARWRHGDFRDVAYFYNWKLYDGICGGLR